MNRHSPYHFATSVATGTTEDENVILVYEAAPGPILREDWRRPKNAPASTMMMVRAPGGAVNHPVPLACQGGEPAAHPGAGSASRMPLRRIDPRFAALPDELARLINGLVPAGADAFSQRGWRLRLCAIRRGSGPRCRLGRNPPAPQVVLSPDPVPVLVGLA